MEDSSGEAEDVEKLYETIREAIQEMGDRELVKIDLSGPRATVVVDVYAIEEGIRTHEERAVYAIEREPNVNVEEAEAIQEGSHLKWTYIGPVEEVRETSIEKGEEGTKEEETREEEREGEAESGRDEE